MDTIALITALIGIFVIQILILIYLNDIHAELHEPPRRPIRTIDDLRNAIDNLSGSIDEQTP